MIRVVDEKFQDYQLKVKGWVLSGCKPPPDVTKDGHTVTFAGMMWQPELDVYSLNHPPLHFAKKVRGRLPKDLQVYDPTMGN